MRFPMRMRNQEEGVGVGGEWEECRAVGRPLKILLFLPFH